MSVCNHGSLRRSCPICERDEVIEQMREDIDSGIDREAWQRDVIRDARLETLREARECIAAAMGDKAPGLSDIMAMIVLDRMIAEEEAKS